MCITKNLIAALIDKYNLAVGIEIEKINALGDIEKLPHPITYNLTLAFYLSMELLLRAEIQCVQHNEKAKKTNLPSITKTITSEDIKNAYNISSLKIIDVCRGALLVLDEYFYLLAKQQNEKETNIRIIANNYKTNADAFFNLECYEEALGDYKNGLGKMQSISAAEYDCADFFDKIATTLCKLGKDEEAAFYQQKSLELKEGACEKYAAIKTSAEKMEKVEQSISLSLELSPEFSPELSPEIVVLPSRKRKSVSWADEVMSKRRNNGVGGERHNDL